MRNAALGVLLAIPLVPSTAAARGFEAHMFIVARAIHIPLCSAVAGHYVAEACVPLHRTAPSAGPANPCGPANP